jgi:hypothetical protein
VLARSIFHHSINYRSVVVVGRAAEVVDPNEKLRALEAFGERVLPGRWAEVRPPTRRCVWPEGPIARAGRAR